MACVADEAFPGGACRVYRDAGLLATLNGAAVVWSDDFEDGVIDSGWDVQS